MDIKGTITGRMDNREPNLSNKPQRIETKIRVIDLMVLQIFEFSKSFLGPGKTVPVWRRCKPSARVAILEGRVSVNGRRVTHTEVMVPRGGFDYDIEVYDMCSGQHETIRTTA